MKVLLLLIVLSVSFAGCTTSKVAKVTAVEHLVGCAHNHELPPLQMDAAAKAILTSRNSIPRTAIDYYFALPSQYFSIMENTPERRATFVKKESLTDTYLHAERWFECDGGGFEVTVRVFESSSGPMVAIESSTYDAVKLLSVNDPPPGDLEGITLHRPKFWRYADDRWIEINGEILPMLTKDEVVGQYRNRFKAHLNSPDQRKFIYLAYRLPEQGPIVEVVGRENFMASAPTWARFTYDGIRFRPSGGVEQAAAAKMSLPPPDTYASVTSQIRPR